MPFYAFRLGTINLKAKSAAPNHENHPRLYLRGKDGL